MASTRAVVRPTAIVQSLLHNSLQYARVRLEILELELSAERERVGAMMKFGLMLSLAALVTVQLTAALVLAYYWNTPWRFHALFVLIAAGVVASALAWRALRRLQQRSSRPLATVLRDLERIGKADDST